MNATRSKKSAAANAVVANGDGVTAGSSLGRMQLKGVLDGLVKRSINEDKLTDGVTIDGDVEEGARDLLELNSADADAVAETVVDTVGVAVGGANGHSSRKRSSSVRRRGRKRRKKDCVFLSDSSDDESKQRHIPHVMTLFDRKVDLARFTTTTPIYTMCRDWMCNNPDNLRHYSNHSNAQGHAHSTVPVHNDHVDVTTPASLPNDSAPLPAPIPLPTDGSGQVVRLDIPKPLPPLAKSGEEFDKMINDQNGGSMSVYKTAHLRRWREIRSQWRKASSLNQARYSDSLRVLRDMFQR